MKPSPLQRIPPPILLAGPTASGKSEAALILAERLNGEIVSVDSMQVYRGLDIGTAKPNAAERARVPHHLIDVVELTAPFDAARFISLASTAIQEITSRHRQPILCGGTGLYFKALLDGLGEAPPSDPALRTEIEATPIESLLRELSERDPTTFDRIDRRNPRRIIRAIEVIRLTGKSFSTQRAAWKNANESQARVFALRRDAQDLRARIDRRVDAMFAAGLVDETRRALDHGLATNPTALQAIGYRQVAEHLRGDRSLNDTVELVKTRTRQFAKRQMTWFRRQLPVAWIDVEAEAKPESIAERIIHLPTAHQ